ncbi:MAG: glycoside hydrolase family 3 N-terminal domain-containing protein, partial [Paenibacillus sp.]
MDGRSRSHRSRSLWTIACLLLLAALLVGGCSGARSNPSPSVGEDTGGSGTNGTGTNQGQTSPSAPETPEPPETPPDPAVELLAQLSTDEKIGQLVLVGMEGTKPDDVTRMLIEEYHVGGFIFYKDNIQDAKQVLDLINGLKTANQNEP